MNLSGFALYDKPAGMTSFAALSVFKREGRGIRLGHTGTLDSFATGLLVIVAGSYRRLAPWFSGLDKEYMADIRFGTGTDTLDPTGTVTATAPPPDRASLEAALPGFRGEIFQRPPKYSAVHVEGARASERARRGEDFDIPARPVTIYGLDILSYEDGLLRLGIRCSSGTYVRSLARDLAEACGSAAHVAALRRTSVGPFRVEDAAEGGVPLAPRLRTIDAQTASSLGLGIATLAPETERLFVNGNPEALGSLIITSTGKSGHTAVFGKGGSLLGVVRGQGAGLSYAVVADRREDAACT